MNDKLVFFDDCLQSMKETSRDFANQESMCDLEIEVVNFDKVKDKYVKIVCPPCGAKSVDALLRLEDKSILIEFRNKGYEDDRMSGSELFGIKEKIYDSLLIYCDITEKTISNTRENLDFILVYNSEKSRSREYIEDHINAKANNEEMIRFGLQKYQKLYFKHVHTYDKAKFMNYMSTMLS